MKKGNDNKPTMNPDVATTQKIVFCCNFPPPTQIMTLQICIIIYIKNSPCKMLRCFFFFWHHIKQIATQIRKSKNTHTPKSMEKSEMQVPLLSTMDTQPNHKNTNTNYLPHNCRWWSCAREPTVNHHQRRAKPKILKIVVV